MRRLKAEHKQRNINGSSRLSELCVMATGGGAYKYYDKIKEALGVEVIREDEIECLIIGTYIPSSSNFLVRLVPALEMDEC